MAFHPDPDFCIRQVNNPANPSNQCVSCAACPSPLHTHPVPGMRAAWAQTAVAQPCQCCHFTPSVTPPPLWVWLGRMRALGSGLARVLMDPHEFPFPWSQEKPESPVLSLCPPSLGVHWGYRSLRLFTSTTALTPLLIGSGYFFWHFPESCN